MYASLSRLIQSDLLLVFPLLTQNNAMKHPYHYSIYSSTLFRIVQCMILKKKYDVLLLLILSFCFVIDFRYLILSSCIWIQFPKNIMLPVVIWVLREWCPWVVDFVSVSVDTECRVVCLSNTETKFNGTPILLL